MGKPSKILDIKTADLKAAAPTFHEQSVALAKAARTLKEKLDGLGHPWGGDKEVAKFREAYGANHTKITDAVKILVDGLQSIHDAMHDMADGHVENDELVKAMFSKAGVKAGGKGQHGGPEGSHHGGGSKDGH